MLKQGLRNSAVVESTCSERASTVSNKHHVIGFFWLFFLAVTHNFYQACMCLYVVSVFRANVANTFMEISWGLGLLFFYSEWVLLLSGDWVIDNSGLLLGLQRKPIGSAYETKPNKNPRVEPVLGYSILRETFLYSRQAMPLWGPGIAGWFMFYPNPKEIILWQSRFIKVSLLSLSLRVNPGFHDFFSRLSGYHSCR